ncbi:MAG: IreB family regulatory phosphoprotein [Terrisporobacter sp.]|uniref:IreB family regulatory phosphoprotein n=1 Tax=Terrisporobacter sp. TaxID=1965305 RepID=UPI002FC974E3
MDNNLDYTMKFEGVNESKSMSIDETIMFVYHALQEKGYDPINQMIGYILSGDSSYITSHKNARTVIRKYERDELLEVILKFYLSK